MATKSILKNVTIKDRTLAKNFVIALENAEQKKGKHIDITKSYSVASTDEIRKMFGDN